MTSGIASPGQLRPAGILAANGWSLSYDTPGRCSLDDFPAFLLQKTVESSVGSGGPGGQDRRVIDAGSGVALGFLIPQRV
jgi:hypothetical protein